MSDESVIKQNEQSQANILPEKTNQKRKFNLISTILIMLCVIGAVLLIRFSTNQKAEESQEKARQAGITKQQVNEKNDNEESQKAEAVSKALNIFITSKYKGWKIQGKNLKDDSANNNVVYDLDLVAGDKDKIIPVVVEKFQKENDDEYWIAYQPAQSELIEKEIQSIKNKIAENETNDQDSSKDNDNDDTN